MGCASMISSKSKAKFKANTTIQEKRLIMSGSIRTQPSPSVFPCKTLIVTQNDNFKSNTFEAYDETKLLFDNSINCAVQFKHLKEAIQAHNESLVNYKVISHADCIRDFNFSKGLSLLLIYIKVNYKQVQISRMSSYPYIKIRVENENDPLLKAWDDLTLYIKYVQKGQKIYEDFLHVQYIYSIFLELSRGEANEFCDKSEKIKLILEKCISEGRELIEAIEKIKNNILFLSNKLTVREKDLEDLASICMRENLYSIAEITHFSQSSPIASRLLI